MEKLNERIASLEKSVAQVAKGVDAMRQALLGNEFDEKSAYKTRIEVLEDKLTKIDLKILKATIWGYAIGFIFCAILEFLYKYTSIVKH